MLRELRSASVTVVGLVADEGRIRGKGSVQMKVGLRSRVCIREGMWFVVVLTVRAWDWG